MADPMVRILGTVTDISGQVIDVGVDYDTVRIGAQSAADLRFTQDQAEEFGRLFVAACWEAAGQRAQMAEGDRA